MKSPIMLLRAVFIDLKRLNPDAKGLDRDLQTIEKRYKHEGFSFLSVSLPNFDRAILDGLRRERYVSPIGFKTSKGTVLPRFLSGLTNGVFDLTTGLLLEEVDVGKLKSLREVLNLFKKFQLDPAKSDELAAKEEEKFFTNDSKCGRHHVDPFIRDKLVIAGRFVLPTLNEWDVTTQTCKHGPGAVFEGVTGNQKWSLLYDILSSKDVDIDVPGLGEFFYARYGLVDHNQLELFPRSDAMSLFASNSGSSARLVSVPKDSKSVRTITVEPLYKQYVQQGLNKDLRSSILSCPVLSNSIALSDQSKSQKLAMEGSINREWATLDLKSASDLLSLEVVRYIFSSKVRFLEELERARSTTIEGKDSFTMAKFAGMGNATTFPVQSVCFAVIGIASILEYQGKPWSTRNVLAASRHIRVYGDDIAVKAEYAHQVVAWLELAGLTVNENKSYLRGNFRESCGVDAFRGYDVTPVYASILPGLSRDKANTLASSVSLSNNLFARGLYSASEYVKNQVESVYKCALPLVTSTSGGLGWTSRQEAFTPTKWCESKQGLVAKTLALTPIKTRDELDGYPALLKFFHSEERKVDHLQPLETEKDHLEMSPMRRHNRISRVEVHC